ncbi:MULTISPECIES: sensor histidine kinase [Streptomyces]|uniref:sensor histidine kinase n=1 Tax=Streptomyces TaxID=1883 RepID=UPI001E28F80A|nr:MULTISPECIES: histidine kinase [Streptomyces]UFQ17264.1 histidine kinase [Streptomyces huasconensis]WCL86869.1 histidine kinase [Streptomyces sp. JCM 35825]
MERRTRSVLLWAALTVPVVSVDRLGMNEPRPAWQQAASLAVLAGAVAVRRTGPLPAFLAAAALGLATGSSLFTLSYGPALAVFALLLGRRADRARPALLAFGAVALAGTVKIAVRDVDPVVEWLVLMGTLVFGTVFPWLTGRYWRQGRELAAAGWARADQLEREQRIVADRARLRERARIAQDMHDSLGHELSLIAVRAGALQVAPDLPDRHRAAAADLRAAASQATDRLHAIIGLLREDDDERAPLAPAGESVAELVARAAESGLEIAYEDEADAHASVPPSAEAAPAERTVHRVVQEALTNAARHAPGAHVTVTVARGRDATTVTVTNGRPREPGSPSEGGSGLRGLRARVTDLGGTFDAGPHGDGFRVTARVPAERAAPAPPPPFGARLAYARRRTVLAFGAAVATGALLVGGTFAWYAYSRTHQVLDPADYARLRLGVPRAEVAHLLPDQAATDPPVERAPTPPPEGADCAYYRASGELFTAVPYFRLCFGGDSGDSEGDRDRLVDKAVIPTAGEMHKERVR